MERNIDKHHPDVHKKKVYKAPVINNRIGDKYNIYFKYDGDKRTLVIEDKQKRKK